MSGESVRSRFHYGFYAAMKVCYDLMKAPVAYEQEKELGEDPVRLDFLIIKKLVDVTLEDPIGKFFRRVNICEYKSPEDGLSIDDFYKVQGYGLIYKGFDRKVNELPIDEMTITLVRHAYPREMIKALKSDGFTISQAHSGIYYIDGKIRIPVQLVVSSQLPAGEYAGLRLLAKGCTKSDIINYAGKASASRDSNIMTNADTVIGVCLSANEALIKILKEEASMNDTSETTKKIFEFVDNVESEAEKRGIEFSWDAFLAFYNAFDKGANQEKERIAQDMLKKKLPLSLIAEITELPKKTIRKIAKSLGVAVV